MRLYRVGVTVEEGGQFITGGIRKIEKEFIVEDLSCLVEYSLENIRYVNEFEVIHNYGDFSKDGIKNERNKIIKLNMIAKKKSVIKELDKQLSKEIVELYEIQK